MDMVTASRCTRGYHERSLHRQAARDDFSVEALTHSERVTFVSIIPLIHASLASLNRPRYVALRARPPHTYTWPRDGECENARAGPSLHSCVLECRDPYVYRHAFQRRI